MKQRVLYSLIFFILLQWLSAGIWAKPFFQDISLDVNRQRLRQCIGDTQ